MEWLLSRTVITGEQAAELDAEARQRAFWIGAGLQHDQIQRVYDENKRAKDRGEDLASFKRRVVGLLKDDAHTETVFRNAAQRSYNAGRWKQLREVRRWRPFWKYDAILDGRTTQVCKARDGVTLSAESTWWKTNWPPLHHRCRSTVRSVRSGSLTAIPPALPVTPGFGLSPEGDPVWKPDPSKHNAELLAEVERKRTKLFPKKAPKSPAEHEPKHWEKEYSHLGEAAGCAAYGRAAYERGLDRTAGEVLTELRRLRDGGHPSVQASVLVELAWLPAERKLPGTVYGTRQRTLLALSEHTRTVKPGPDLEFAGDQPLALSEAKKFYRLTLDASVKRPDGYRVQVQPGVRAYASASRKLVALDQNEKLYTVIHELAHTIEDVDKRAYQRSLAFLNARTRNETAQALSDLDKRHNYDPWEKAKADKFLEKYVGKLYDHQGTEVTSMGYGDFFSTARRNELGDGDPEWLYFLLGQLAGK